MNEDKMKEINRMIRKKSMFEFWLGAAGVRFGLLMLFLPLRSLFRYISAKTDVFEVNADDLAHDIWYKCENNILLGNYADDEDGAFYVTTTGDNQFMGFYVPKASVEKADRIMEAGWTYLDGDTQDWPDEYLTGAGYVRWMTEKEKSYFKAWFDGADNETMSMLSYQTFYLCTPVQALFEREIYIILVIGGGFLLLLSLIKVIVF
ncbi:MAG: hypothetical protein IJ711_13415, partial [Lachnospiraceae bacterium]|nr:hypothetical protein [Lachnospiraceae bacterium]